MTDVITRENHLIRSERIITKLKAISSINPGDRWNTYQQAPQKPGIFQKISRTIWYISEDKCLNIADLENSIETAFGILQDIKNSSDYATPDEQERYYQVAQRIKQSVLSARDGINNLQVVYHENEAVIFKIENIVKKIYDMYNSFVI